MLIWSEDRFWPAVLAELCRVPLGPDTFSTRGEHGGTARLRGSKGTMSGSCTWKGSTQRSKWV